MKKKESPIRTSQHEYCGNESGFFPFDCKVLVLPDYIEETSEGGIVLNSNTVDQHDLVVTEGYLVASGGGADVGELVSGDRVVWAMYAGQMIDGDDEKQYRLINDTDLVASRVVDDE
ncbi:MAG: hypothetical protein ACC707_16800 [Thiohalomonadales bacterium]